MPLSSSLHGSAQADLPDMAASYDAYFRSGLYHSRYPQPNRRTLRFVRRHLRPGGRLIDFGAGEGRYALALAQQDGARILATDVSAVARGLLASEAARRGLSARIDIAGTDDPAYRQHAIGSRSFDVALLGFGVLGHVAGRAKRVTVLSELRSCLTPQGRLIMGLPNAARRFRAEQAEAAPRVARGEFERGDILYRRASDSGEIALFYHLFRTDEIVAELQDAGFAIETLTSESVLPERAVTHSPLLGVIDDAVSALLPVQWAYGYLVVARPL